MSSRIHPQARTTPKIRQEIKDSGLSDREAAKVFNISRATARKWLKRDDVQDRSHRKQRAPKSHGPMGGVHLHRRKAGGGGS